MVIVTEKCPLFQKLYFIENLDIKPFFHRFYYDGEALKLSQDCEEIATFYGRMLDHDYTTKEVFNKNFFKVNPLKSINIPLLKINLIHVCAYVGLAEVRDE